MSYILDALKKSDQERKRGEVPTITSVSADTGSAEGKTKQIGLKIIAGGVALGVVIIAGVMLIDGKETPPPLTNQTADNVADKTTGEIAQNDVVDKTQTTERSTEPEPEINITTEKEDVPKPSIKAKPKAKTSQQILKSKKPEKTLPIVAAKPIDADIPKPDPSATEAPPPAPQPVNDVSKAPAPKRVPGSSVAPQPAVAAKTQKPKSALPALGSATQYLDRGWDSMDRGLFNQAAADFSTAVEMEPGFADGWFALGWAQEKNSQDTSAIASYGRAIRVRADHAGALFSRGYLQLFSGNPLGATRDFNATANLAKGDFRLYTHIWAFIAKGKTGIDGTNDIKTNSQNDDLSSWPGQVIRYYAGELNETQLVQSIEDGDNPNLQERRCAGYFFLGEYALLRGDSKKARDYFEKSLATGVVKLRQFDASRRELAKMAK